MQARVWGAALAAILVTTSAATAKPGREGLVECWGTARLQAADAIAARQNAIDDGLRRCLEKVVGIYVQSTFTHQQQETVRNHQNAFTARVQDELLKKSEGYVEHYDVLDEERRDGSLRVKLRARVFESKLQAEARRLADLLSAAGDPRLMLVMQDIYSDASGDERVDASSVLAAYLEKELLARGITLIANQEASRLALLGRAEYDELLGNPDAAMRLAREQGADLVLVGRVEIVDRGVIQDGGGFTALVGQRRVEIKSVIKGVNVATGELLTSAPLQTSSIGTTTERAIHRALQGRGANVVRRTFQPLLEDLKRSLKKTAEDGQSYVVQLRGVTSFRQQGRRFLDVLGGVSGVSRVRQKSFQNGQLEVDVGCRCSSRELQERIFQAASAEGELQKLDIEGISGKQLTFRL